MKLLIALLVAATVMDLSLSASIGSLQGRAFSSNRRSSAVVPRASVQANARKLDRFLTGTFSRTRSHKSETRGGEDMHDIILVLDRSGSISSGEFIKAKQFMADIVSLLPSTISRDNTRIACISFSDANNIKIEFGFLTYTSKSSVIQAIKRIPYHTGGSTHTTKALQMAKALFETTGRPCAQKTIFLSTDGHSNGGGNPAVPADQMKNSDRLDVTIFVAAVSQSVNVQEVESIASSPAHVIYLNSFYQATLVTGEVRKMVLSRRLLNPALHGWLTGAQQ